MRKFIFYLLLIKKVLLLLVYPLFLAKSKFCAYIRLRIENYLIFQPSRLRAKRIQRGLLKKISTQRFVSLEGVRLYAWYIPPVGDNPVFLYFHGQAESILSHQDVAMFALSKGYGLFMLSYRGHYKSAGIPSEKGIYNDAQTAISQLKTLGIAEDRLILWGHSLGSAVAVNTALKNNVRGVVLQSPIKEIKSAAVDVYNFYCNRLHLPLLAFWAKHHIGNIKFIQKFDNISKISKINCPILILHPKSDNITPFKNAVELAAQSSGARLVISDVGTHYSADWCFGFIEDALKHSMV